VSARLDCAINAAGLALLHLPGTHFAAHRFSKSSCFK